MKLIKSILFALAATAMSVGCEQNELPNPYGEMEDPNNYGVYFPTQTSSTNLQLEAKDPAQVVYRVRRTNVLDPIIVPTVITVTVGDEEIANPESIFKVEPIAFDSGEEESKFKVSFENAEVGKEYSVNIRVEDPKYISIYGEKETGISFTVLRANWKSLGIGKWRDDIISSMYGGITNPNAEIDVEIYEREDLPGYFRMQAFSGDLVYALFGQRLETEGNWTVIDASDPDAVWLPRQSTGLQINSSDGVINIASNVDKIFSMDASENAYGTYKDGIITFPVQGILANLPGYSATGWYAVNSNGLHRIILPGYREYDYSVTFTKGEAYSGVLNADVVLGEDVDKICYKIYEGTLDEAQVSLNAQDLDSGKETFDGEMTASGTLAIRGLNSGKYTLVACTYANGSNEMRGYGSMSFGFIAEGDERPIVLHFGLEATDEYAGVGVNTDNSARLYLYGEEIESLKMSIVRTARISGVDMREYVETVGTEFTAEQLSQVNGGHYSTMITSLNGNSEYTLILLANNGYVSEVLTTTYTTTGTFNPLIESYSYMDFLSKNPGKADMLSKSYSLYGVNLMDEEPELRRIGSVTLMDDTENDVYNSSEIIDYIRVKGMTGLTFDNGETGILAPFIPGTSGLSLYKGQFGLYAQGSAIGTIGGSDVMCGFVPAEDLNIYTGLGMYVGAVADGYYAVVPNPDAIAQGYTFAYFCAFNSSAIYSMLCDMVIVDDSKNPVIPGKAAMKERREYYKALKASIKQEIPDMLSNKPLIIEDNMNIPVKLK